jgi:ATP phosphoribosyltransferase regulatory subunit HisZ
MSISDRDLLPEGLEDRLPREAATTTRVMRAIHGVMHAHGYDRVLPPMIEFDETLAHRMAGIRSRRMFRFVDPQSLRMLMMRGDHTPQISRCGVASGWSVASLAPVLRRAGSVDPWRWSRPGPGKAAMRR